MSLEIIQVDAFTQKPFQGNPAAVCVTAAALPEALMQSVAAELNLSETAFVWPQEDGFSLRWFTPAAEVDLCGHATLASAHVLWSEGHLSVDQTARFQTRSGLLTAQRQEDWIQLNFPVQPVRDATVTPQLIAALGPAEIHYVGKNETNYLVVLRSQTALTNLKPNFDKVKALPVQGIIATSQASDQNYDFVSRYFAPAVGINEDPVTGSTHCSLAPYWQDRLGKQDLVAYQISARGGELRLRCEAERIYISGQAVTVMRGQLLLPDEP
jgi:PhzF family phenazine biosynthesis protein